MNKVLLTGYVTKESQVFNEKVIKFTVVTNKNVKVGDNWEVKPSFHQVTGFGYFTKRTISKGYLVSLVGHIDYSNYEKDGVKIYQTSIILDELEVLKKAQNEPPPAPKGSYQRNEEQNAFERERAEKTQSGAGTVEDDLPF